MTKDDRSSPPSLSCRAIRSIVQAKHDGSAVAAAIHDRIEDAEYATTKWRNEVQLRALKLATAQKELREAEAAHAKHLARSWAAYDEAEAAVAKHGWAPYQMPEPEPSPSGDPHGGSYVSHEDTNIRGDQ